MIDQTLYIHCIIARNDCWWSWLKADIDYRAMIFHAKASYEECLRAWRRAERRARWA